VTAISTRNAPSVSTDRPGTGSDRIWVRSFANTDPSDWKALEKTLASFMEQRIKMLRVDYVVTYEKTVMPKFPVGAEGEVEALSDVDEPAAKRTVFSCHHIMLIAETYYSNGQIEG